MCRQVTLTSINRVLIQPIRPEVKDGLLDGIQRLTMESRYRRFFSPMPELSARHPRYLTTARTPPKRCTHRTKINITGNYVGPTPRT